MKHFFLITLFFFSSFTKDEPFFSTNWEETFIPIATKCLPSAHPSPARFKVWIDTQDNANEFNAGGRDFPMGTVILKALYNIEDTTCSDIVWWTVMRKKIEGEVLEGRDWEWQSVNILEGGEWESVTEPDSKTFCWSCHAPRSTTREGDEINCTEYVCVPPDMSDNDNEE